MDGKPVIILRPAYKDPTWLEHHQKRLARANLRAAEETRHLTGPVRVIAMNLLKSKYMKEDAE
jgi:hypothetical protein